VTAQPLVTDVLSPPAAGGSAQVQAADALAGELLEQFHLEQLETDLAAASPRPQAPQPPRQPLPQEVEDALYAWGVSCHEAGRHADASALFGALCRRQPASVRLLKAAGASHLACADPARSAQAYAQAHALARTDAEILYFWAQAEGLMGQSAAATLARQAAGLARAFPHKWPGLLAWCDELLAQLEPAPSVHPESRTHPQP
jgi:predicted Zn-dependent protease